MLAAALGDGTAGLRAVFEVFGRRLPHGRRYGVVGGLGRLLDEIEAFRFTSEQLASLEAQGILDRRTLDHLADGTARLDSRSDSSGRSAGCRVL